jgi:hypothetical protein
MRISNLECETEMICHLDAKVIVIDLGSNDLGNMRLDAKGWAKFLFEFGLKIVSQRNVKVILIEQFKRIRSTGVFDAITLTTELKNLINT